MRTVLRSANVDLARAADVLRRTFWFLPLVAMLTGGGLGVVLPELDSVSDGALGIFTTSERDSARGLLETIATVTVSVAGITFSVTVVALQLASQQLGPRVLRTFQGDRLNQATLAVFLGLFIYALVALGRLSVAEEASSAPNLVLTFGVVVALCAFVLFALFVQNTIVSLQASTVIARIVADADQALERLYPAGFGEPAASTARPAPGRAADARARAPASGFLNALTPEPLLEAAADADGLVLQRVRIGDYVLAGEPVVDVYAERGADRLAERVAEVAEVGEERTLVQDPAFPLRQLSDIALRALSPSLNDPTTAENAMGAVAGILAAAARHPEVEPARADADGTVRFLALAPSLDDLVRLGFEQVCADAGERPVLAARLAELLEQLARIARQNGRSTSEIDRQRDALRG